MNLSPEGNKAADATSGTPIGPEPVSGVLASTPAIEAPLGPIGWFGKTLKLFGPGLITGAADDDPSGIATYSSVGAQFGTSMLWTMPLIYPFMAAIQEISARVGRVTGRGIAGNMRRFYPSWMLYVVVALLIVANIINIGRCDASCTWKNGIAPQKLLRRSKPKESNGQELSRGFLRDLL